MSHEPIKAGAVSCKGGAPLPEGSRTAPRGDWSVLFLADGDGLSVCSDDERIGLVRFDAVVFDTETVWTLEADEATIFIVDIFFGTPPVI